MSELALPTGTVTFLLTDIEGSSRLWEEHPERMGGAVQRHDELIARAVAEHRGGLVKSKGEGDSTFSVFARPTDAVAAAVAAQRALGAEAWPDGMEISARAALHTGESELREGDYFGTAVNRCARLRAVAHGGQTICSQSTADLVADGLPDGVGIRSLGTHRLRDLERPEQIFQISRADFPEEFPPLRSLDAFRHNLPAQRTSFVGREDQLIQVQKLLGNNRLVTLTGVGGCGKTRLALQAAADVLDSFDAGVFFVELAPVSDPDVIYATVASAVGVPRSAPGIASGRGVREDLLDFLRDLDALIVLDNCEHLVDACAELVDEILDGCPQLRVLATSREALEVEGEQTYSVPSLSVPTDELPLEAESTRLFEERASAVRADFRTGPDNVADVAEICRRLDGIPLAIELAAAQISHLSPHQIADRLKDRFRLLTGGRRRVQRQQTLGAALDWSYELLLEAERELLRRLAVFPGSFTLDAAEAVCGEGTIGALRSLVSKSLVIAVEGGADLRYRLLETVRLYAEEKLLGANEADEYRTRHCDYVADWVQSWPVDTHVNAPAATRFVDEEHNIRTALEWSASQEQIESVARIASASLPLWVAGRHDEGGRWIGIALGELNNFDEELQARLLGAGSWVANLRLEGDEMLSLAQRCLEVSGDQPSVWTFLAHGNVALYESFLGALGDEQAAASAREHGRRAVETAHATSDRLLSGALLFEGLTLSGVGDLEAAVDRLSESMDASRGDQDAYATFALAASRRAYVLHLLGRNDEALDSARDAVRFADDWIRSFAAMEVGWQLMSRGALALALAALGRFREAYDSLREIGDTFGTVRVPGALGDMLVAVAGVVAIKGDFERASRILAAAGRENVTRSPTTMVLYRHYVGIVRSQLDRATARRCREEGFLMSGDEAFAYGLEGMLGA